MSLDVLYLHGFASSPGSRKVELLRERLEPGVRLITPDLNVPSFEALSFEAMVRHAGAIGAQHDVRAVVGSSLGGLVALEVMRRGLPRPSVLIAPALGVKQRWLTRIADGDPVEVFNHARNGKAWIHRAFFEEMNGVVSDDGPPERRTVIVMGRNDESVPFSIVEDQWRAWEASGRLPEGSRMIVIEEGDHGLTAWADLIADEIRLAAGGLDVL